MKLFTPEIAWHNQEPVLSLDIKKIDANLYKAVTSGSDRHLVVWKITLSLPSVLDSTSGSSCTLKKQITIEPLADLNRHPKAINVVKFSSNVNFFASGDDEGNIFVWKLQDKSGEPMVTGDNDASGSDKKLWSGNCFEDPDGNNNIEDWCLYKTLRGHNEDVVDLCWSPNGQFLLSGSVDNDAIVWDVNKGVRISYLAGHKGYVQGVAWDPADNYIITLSTDRSLRVFNTSSKRLIYKVYKSAVKIDEDKVKMTRLFYDDTLPTYSRRVCFSPGGELLFAPSGVVELDPDEENFKFTNAVHIFTRNCINKPKYYLSTGNLYNTAVKCCPQRFELKQDLANPFPFPYRIIFAVATQESVLLFDTQQIEPFASISNIHYTRLTDISWSDDGRLLMISSTDGYCSFIIFDESEFGIPYNGSYYKYEVSTQNDSCASSPAKEGQDIDQRSPLESSASKPKRTPEVTKITNFFRKLDKSDIKGSVKRKEVVDLTNAESPLKKFHSSKESSSEVKRLFSNQEGMQKVDDSNKEAVKVNDISG
ncbi:chromatin assembly factor 1 subunit B-like [Panonychus citri]|uniref:chromatin assembly factor 1 subunit B-like n=1 Tax=Panonychus citri TaxID=50023 RepID=UPI0023075744|nr:chromatin assembly factor 1 subunit B-like [Panonychus citri]